MAIRKAYNYEDLSKMSFRTLPVTGHWQQHLGIPQLGNSSWLVYGDSGQGKTSYVLQMLKELTKYEPAHYNTLEEGTKRSFQLALERENIKSIKSKFNFQQEDFQELDTRLSRKRQPKIVVIDSVQYFFRGLQSRHYFEFVRRHRNTLFIWLSGADGNLPKGKIADDIRYDSDIVIKVKDFEAVVEKNRFEAEAPHIIWQQGFENRQLKLLNKG